MLVPLGVSIFLARLLGIYLVIIALALFARKEQMRASIADFAKSLGLEVFAGAITLFLGIILVLAHNVWQLDWRVLITLLAWLTVLKGMCRLFFPAHLGRCAERLLNPTVYYSVAALLLLAGLFLTLVGFSI